jgi:apolipoprotein N-acyltransferase
MQKMRRFFYYALLPFLSGALYALGYPQKDFFYHMILAHIGVFLLFFQLSHLSSLKKKILSLLCYSLGYNLLGYYWIPETIKEFGDISFPINYLIGTSFSLIILPHFFIFTLSQWFLAKKKGLYLGSFASACFITLLEYFVPQQFPAHLSHSWLQLAPYIGLTPYFGANLYSFISYFAIFSLLIYLHQKRKATLLTCLTIILPLIIVSIYSPLTLDYQDTLRVRLTQANIGNMLKISSEKGYKDAEKTVYERYKRLALKQARGEKPRLIIWPETAYPELLMTKYMTTIGSIPKTVQEVTTQMDAYLFTGGYDRADPKSNGFFETQYNAALFFSPQANFLKVYHKSKLIPFGESLPFGPLNKYLVNLNPNIAFFAKGKTTPIFTIDDKYHFMAAICYEVLFSSFIKDYLNRTTTHPHFMINLTNDSWYGDTSEPYQHKYLAHWRALEFQMPLVRMTNTGISNILYQDGSESEALGHNVEDILDLDLKLGTTKPTWFQRFGITPLVLLFAFCYLLLRLLEPFFDKIMKTKKA